MSDDPVLGPSESVSVSPIPQLTCGDSVSKSIDSANDQEPTKKSSETLPIDGATACDSSESLPPITVTSGDSALPIVPVSADAPPEVFSSADVSNPESKAVVPASHHPTCKICNLKFQNTEFLNQHNALMTESIDFDDDHCAIGVQCSYCHKESSNSMLLMKHQYHECEVFQPSQPKDLPVSGSIATNSGLSNHELKVGVQPEVNSSDGRLDPTVATQNEDGQTFPAIKIVNMPARPVPSGKSLVARATSQTASSTVEKEDVDQPTCTVCFVKFENMGFLKQHHILMIESVDFEDSHCAIGLKCSYCQKEVSDSWSLMSHQHGKCEVFSLSQWDDIPGTGPLQLDPKVFNRKGGKATFYLTSRKGGTDLLCEVCPKRRFATSMKLNEHFLTMQYSPDFDSDSHCFTGATTVKAENGTLYNCSHCDVWVVSVKSLQTHLETACPNIKEVIQRHECSRCHMGFASYLELSRHLHWTHTSINLNENRDVVCNSTEKCPCMYCGKVLSIDSLEFHQREECWRSRVSPIVRAKDSVLVRTGTSVNCLQCGVLYPQIKSLLDHLTIMKQSVDFDEKHMFCGEKKSEMFRCSYCGMYLKYFKCFREHLGRCKKLQLIKIDNIEDVQKLKKIQPKHKVNLSKRKNWSFTQCKVCETDLKIFRGECQLSLHDALMNRSKDFDGDTHAFLPTTSKPGKGYPCGYCGKWYSETERYSLEQHQYRFCKYFRVFAREKSIEDEGAQRMVQKLFTPKRMKRNGQSKRNDKLFDDCEVCGFGIKAYKGMNQIKLHAALMHQSEDFDDESHAYINSDETGYYCGYCDQVYPKRYLLEVHQYRTCTGFWLDLFNEDEDRELKVMPTRKDKSKSDKSFTCSECRETFTVAKDLDAHVLLMTESWDFNEFSHLCYKSTKKGDWYRCSYCYQLFASRQKLASHQTHKCDNFSPFAEENSEDEGKDPDEEQLQEDWDEEAEELEKEEEEEEEEEKEENEMGEGVESGLSEFDEDDDGYHVSTDRDTIQPSAKKVKRVSKSPSRKGTEKFNEEANDSESLQLDAGHDALCCSKCDGSFPNQLSLESHIKVMLKSVDFDRRTHGYSGTIGMNLMGGKMYQCSYCPDDFTSKGKLAEHQKELCSGFSIESPGEDGKPE